MVLENVMFFKYLKVHEVSTVTTLSKSTLWLLEKLGIFPTPIPLCGRAKVWSRSDVEEWVKGRIDMRYEKYGYTYSHNFKKYESQPPRLLSALQLAKEYKLPRSSLYELMNTEGFPKQVELTDRRVAWIESEVLDWLESRKLILQAS